MGKKCVQVVYRARIKFSHGVEALGKLASVGLGSCGQVDLYTKICSNCSLNYTQAHGSWLICKKSVIHSIHNHLLLRPVLLKVNNL